MSRSGEPKKWTRRGPLPKWQREEAVRHAQSLMVMGVPYKEVVRTLADKYGVKLTTGEKYVTDARKDWLAEHSRGREELRAEQYAMTLHVMKSAFGRRRIRRDKGQPVTYQDEEGKMQYVTDPDPDYRLAHRCVETLARLSGTFQQRIEVEAEGSIQKFVDKVCEALSDDPDALEKVLAHAKPD